MTEFLITAAAKEAEEAYNRIWGNLQLQLQGEYDIQGWNEEVMTLIFGPFIRWIVVWDRIVKINFF
jgi:hypothetical protein